MTEKTFEEEKPFSVYKYELPDGCKKEIALYNIQQIKKHYLDKRRVKEVINNAYMNSDNDARLDSTEVMKAILFKELGLEDLE